MSTHLRYDFVLGLYKNVLVFAIELHSLVLSNNNIFGNSMFSKKQILIF